MTTDDNLLTIKEAAEILDVHWQTIRNYIRDGKLPSLKIGRNVRIEKKDLEKFLADSSTFDGERRKEKQEPKTEIELRYRLQNRKDLEHHLIQEDAQIIYHGHIIDHWFVPQSISNQTEQNEWFESDEGCGIRIREQDNGYTGSVTTTLEAKKLTDEKDHNTTNEAEIHVDNYEDGKHVLNLIGYKEFLTIDKDRVIYAHEGIKVCIDDIKNFGTGVELEYEGDESRGVAIKKLQTISEQLGFQEIDRLEKSLTRLAMSALAEFE